MDSYPKIKHVSPEPDKKLLVEFGNGVSKRYDCAPLLLNEPFYPLKDDAIFRCAHADPHGYAVIWNDDIDLAESEVWLNGQTVSPGDAQAS